MNALLATRAMQELPVQTHQDHIFVPVMSASPGMAYLLAMVMSE